MKNTSPKIKQEMDLITLTDKFGSDEKCRAYLEALRFPKGVFCLRCESKKISRIYKRKQFVCDACNYQFSVTVGTIFQDSHLPLQKWFAAIYLMCESRKGISANQMKRTHLFRILRFNFYPSNSVKHRRFPLDRCNNSFFQTAI